MNKVKKSAHSAEINVVSDLALETMVQHIEALNDKSTRATVTRIRGDSVRFRLMYIRQGRISATVTGQLRRWADEMTHVVCSGDAIQDRQWRWQRWLMWITAILISLPLVLIATGSFVTGLSGLLMYIGLALGTLTVAAVRELWIRMDWHKIPEERFAAHHSLSPRYKDRDRLLQKIVNCVKSIDPTQHLHAVQSADEQPPEIEAEARQETARDQK